jgi:hypothetical protein
MYIKIHKKFQAFIFSSTHNDKCILSYYNSTAMYIINKNLTPWRDSNPGSSVL